MSSQSFTLIKLQKFKGGLHLAHGNRNSYSESQKSLHSDSIKSALFVCALQLFGSKEIDENFLKSFQISSAFPFVQEGEKELFFFPKPNTQLNIDIVNNQGDEYEGKQKLLKKLSFLEKDLFEKVINNEKVSLVKGQQIEEAYASLDAKGKFNIYKNETFQHVSIARLGESDSVTYYVEKRYFNEDAGLFFLLNCKDEERKKQVLSALRLLSDSGIGTDRNNGNGYFEFHGNKGLDVIENFQLRIPEDASHELSLSLYLPTNLDEIGDLKMAQYELIKRGGYIANPQKNEHLTLRKRSVYMFKEGSLFEKSGNRTGQIADLKPSDNDLENVGLNKVGHPIYRDGMALFIPCKI